MQRYVSRDPETEDAEAEAEVEQEGARTDEERRHVSGGVGLVAGSSDE